MNIYLVKRTDKVGWYEYDSFVVICDNEFRAEACHPLDRWSKVERVYDPWPVKPENIVVILLGTANGKLQTIEGIETFVTSPEQVILASFNAG